MNMRDIGFLLNRVINNSVQARCLETMASRSIQLRHFHLGLQCRKGHSHFQNTRHIKASKDAIKHQKAARVSQQIRLAVREGGSLNPKTNSALAQAINLGAELDVPSKSMQTMIEKASMKRGNSTLIGVNGPNNSAFLIEIITFEGVRQSVSLKHIQKLLDKAGGVLAGQGAVTRNFERKAVINAAPENTELTITDAETLAIECEADDVVQVNQNPCEFKFTAEPDNLYTVCKCLTDSGYQIQQSGVDYLPLSTVSISEKDKELWIEALESLRNIDSIDVESVYDNVEW